MVVAVTLDFCSRRHVDISPWFFVFFEAPACLGVHALHMFKPVITFGFKVLRHGLLR